MTHEENLMTALAELQPKRQHAVLFSPFLETLRRFADLRIGPPPSSMYMIEEKWKIDPLE
jgi:hypothetical protein